MKVLVITPYLPHRSVGHGGGTAVRDLVTWLARKHTVLVLSLVRPGEESLLAEVSALGVEVHGVPFLDRQARGWRRGILALDRLQAVGRSLVSGFPHYVEKYATRVLRHAARQAVADFQPDAVQIEYLQLALTVRDLRRRRDATGGETPRLVLNSHELGSVPRRRRAARAANPFERWLADREAAAWDRLQVAASGWADNTLCVTPEDHELYAAAGGRHLLTVPLGMDLERLRPDWQPGSVDGKESHLFVGSFGHRPNELAAAFLLEHVWPRLLAERPQAHLVLAGRGSREFLAARGEASHWRQRQVRALGFVDDLTPHFRNCRLFLAPLPEGGGIKIKILEAMARGVPTVTTPVGAEGIAAAEDGVLLIASCDAGFAEAVLRAADDENGCRQRAAAARRLIEEKFGWESITDRLAEIYAGAATATTVSRSPDQDP